MVLLVVGSAYACEDVQHQLPVIRIVQSKAHEVLSYANPRQARVQWVTLVEIDDSTFLHDPFGSNSPINRRALADLALTLARVRPMIIALDVQLLSEAGDSRMRTTDNQYLLRAIDTIAGSGIPVVLTRVLKQGPDGEFEEIPNLFPDSELPSGTYVGHVNLPKDPRQLPLQVEARSSNSSSTEYFPSFAQKIVRAYEDVAHIRSKADQNKHIKNALRQGAFVYAGFIRDREFDKISAREILAGSTEVTERCRNRIVIIGGTYNKRTGQPIENFSSPIGEVPGLYLHANYVEALNDRRFFPAVPRWIAMLIDLAAAVLVYGVFLKTRRVLTLVLLALLLLLGPYLCATNFGLYLDFVPLVSVCALHLGIEYQRGLISRAKEPTRAGHTSSEVDT